MTGERCELDQGCITCGDVAVVLTVIGNEGSDALCRDDEGRTEHVATEFVGQVAVGDRLLVHAAVALQRLVERERVPDAIRR
ncbi:MAG: hydrogenase maturation factor [Acidimicrobiaceae bacterium]|nr:hydrogenase maturation factor [Acidimicrobiaceae bacterium]